MGAECRVKQKAGMGEPETDNRKNGKANFMNLKEHNINRLTALD